MSKLRIAHFKSFDWVIIGAVVFLLCLGLLTIYSSLYPANTLNFRKQLSFSLLGLALMFIIGSLVNYRVFKNKLALTILFYIISVALLVGVLVLGPKIRGSSSWFSLGALSFQPVELVKLALILLLARLFSRRFREIGRGYLVVISAAYVGLPSILIMLQPDLGSLLVVIGIWLGMMFLAGVKKRHLFLILMLGLLFLVLSWSFALKPYQKERVLTFIDPEGDPLGSGYNIIQSTIAIGSGRVFGKGLGYGTQSQLNFLPEQHTDFIFASIAEEWGFVGVLFLMSLFGILFLRLIKLSYRCQDNFAKLFIGGVIIMLLLHLFINVGMNLGIFPITGIPLSFISYGGSNLVVTLVALGFVQSMKVRS